MHPDGAFQLDFGSVLKAVSLPQMSPAAEPVWTRVVWRQRMYNYWPHVDCRYPSRLLRSAAYGLQVVFSGLTELLAVRISTAALRFMTALQQQLPATAALASEGSLVARVIFRNDWDTSALLALFLVTCCVLAARMLVNVSPLLGAAAGGRSGGSGEIWSRWAG